MGTVRVLICILRTGRPTISELRCSRLKLGALAGASIFGGEPWIVQGSHGSLRRIVPLAWLSN